MEMNHVKIMCTGSSHPFYSLSNMTSEIQLKPQSTVLMILAIPDSSRYEG